MNHSLAGNPLPTVEWYAQTCPSVYPCKKDNNKLKPVLNSQQKSKRYWIVTPKLNTITYYRYIVSHPTGNQTLEFKLTPIKDGAYQFGIVVEKTNVYEEDPFSFECVVDSRVRKLP